MKRLFIFFCILIFSLSTFAQSNLNDYSFVVVPENFSFTSEKDQFQLNSMTKYYLNEYGFNAFFQSELPRVNNCDGLYAEVISKGSFITTITVVYLKDCEGKILLESGEGRSKKKDYRQAYQESLRDALKSIQKLNVNQTNIVVDTSASNVDIAAAKRLNVNTENVENKQTTSKVIVDVSENTFVKGPDLKFSYYKKDASSYLLRKSKNGYLLYLEDESKPMGLVLLGTLVSIENEISYLIEGQLTGVVKFQQNGDLLFIKENATEVFKFQN